MFTYGLYIPYSIMQPCSRSQSVINSLYQETEILTVIYIKFILRLAFCITFFVEHYSFKINFMLRKAKLII